MLKLINLLGRECYRSFSKFFTGHGRLEGALGGVVKKLCGKGKIKYEKSETLEKFLVSHPGF